MAGIIKEIKKEGISLSKKRGQCLLIDDGILEKIIDTAEITEHDMIIDIGTGPGHLIGVIAPLAKCYAGVEIDRKCYESACKRTGEIENLRLIHADILQNKHTLNPEVMAMFKEMIDEYKPDTVKIVANLPYNVAVSVIMDFLVQDKIDLERLVVMTQREVGIKLSASIGDSEYRALSASARLCAEIKVAFHVPKDSFRPRPKVESSVLVIFPKPDKDLPVRKSELKEVINFVRKVFNFPRKRISNAILNSHVSDMNKAEIEELLTENGVDSGQGVSQTPVEDFLTVYRAMNTEG